MFVLPDLPYDYSALEPFIDTETMHIHYDKHHATYVKNLNDLLVGYDDLLNMDINDLLKNLDKVPEDIRQKVKNNAGGVANHNMFWKVMTPNTEERKISDKFMKVIYDQFGSPSSMMGEFEHLAQSHFGSGWIWIVSKGGKLRIVDSLNQDSPIMNMEGDPILCLDVWEHAYYLKYKNVRADYINAWWNVVNWREVEKLYDGIQ